MYNLQDDHSQDVDWLGEEAFIPPIPVPKQNPGTAPKPKQNPGTAPKRKRKRKNHPKREFTQEGRVLFEALCGMGINFLLLVAGTVLWGTVFAILFGVTFTLWAVASTVALITSNEYDWPYWFTFCQVVFWPLGIVYHLWWIATHEIKWFK